MINLNLGHSVKRCCTWMATFSLAALTWCYTANAAVNRVRINGQNQYLIAEFLTDSLIHFETSAVLPGPDASQPIYTTPMIKRTDYNGPTEFQQVDAYHFMTRDLAIAVEPTTLCVTYRWRSSETVFTKQCPTVLNQARKTIKFSKESTKNVYGLGEQFLQPGDANGQWVGKKRTPGNEFGNQMVGYNGGAVGNATFPVLYALGAGYHGFGMFFDHVYAQEWDFTGNPFTLNTYGDQVRWYFFAAPDLPGTRRIYMDLVGRPTVPPRKAFGLWISEYGFDTWDEVRSKLQTLRANKFPLDGFVLDLQWFGGVIGDSEQSPMGRLTWDTKKFPSPQSTLKSFKDDGVGFITIEESYISRGLPEHKILADRQALAKDCEDCGPTFIEANPWWGKGGMIDWTNDAGAAYWHDLKRAPLVRDGVLGHWTDLGEPEMFNSHAWYYGFPKLGKYRHADVHNILNLKWAESIAKGYVRSGFTQRPFIMSRSGTSGIQRHGAALWSGDIGSNLTSLATHLNTQMHMALSGIDYYGADIGGFHRSGLQGDLDEMYTQWFANGASFDVPVRVHTENLCNCKETAPDRIGDMASNLENIRTRYRLIPYLYSLAHKAYETGDAVFPPIVYYYQNDPNVRELGHEKLIGRDMLVAIVARHGESSRDVYLPAGEWYNFDSNDLTKTTGAWVRNLPEYKNGKFSLPRFMRAGAVIPMMFVDEGTLDSFGRRTDGQQRDELVLRAYRGSGYNSFTLYEDDGESVAYQQGNVRKTELSQNTKGKRSVLTVGGSVGSFKNAASDRAITVEFVVDDKMPNKVVLNGTAVPFTANLVGGPRKALEAAWTMAEKTVVVQIPRHQVNVRQTVEFSWD